MDLYDVDNTTWLLQQWGVWAPKNPVLMLGYPTIEPYWKMVAKSGGRNLMISDEQACEIEKLLCRLVTRDEEMGRTTMLYYLMGCNASKVARVILRDSGFQLNRKQVDVLVNSGTAWVDAKLDSMREKKEVA